MNDLNAQQLILLALFVSFVTSIATGIFTVSLLEQAPPVVTQTINRVVERTVETVVEGKTEVVNTVSEVRSDDLLARAVSQVSPTVVEVLSGAATSSGASVVGGVQGARNRWLGFVVSDGIVAMSTDDTSNEAMFVSSSGGEYPASTIASSSGVVLLSVKDLDIAAPKQAYDLGLGQSVFTLGYDDGLQVMSRGFISGYRPRTASSSEMVNVSITPGPHNTGAPVVTADGTIVGLLRSDGRVVGIQDILELLADD